MILITGGTGLLGSHLLYALLKEGNKVRAIKRSTSNLAEVKRIFSFYTDKEDELFKNIQWVDADLLVPESLDKAFTGISHVYHAAALVSFDPRDKAKLIKNNREVSANVVNACLQHKVKKLLHVSSTSALGSSQNGELINEECIWSPDKFNTGYSISKFKSEMEVWRGIEEGLSAVIVNPSIILGPGFWNRGSASMFSNIKKGLKFYSEGVTGFIGVEDVAQFMIKLMNSDISGERFILNSENLSYHEAFDLIAASLKVKAPSVEASPFLSGMAWRLDAFRSYFGVPRVITKEAVRASMNICRFSNEKVKKATNMDFQKMKDVIEKTGKIYLKHEK